MRLPFADHVDLKTADRIIIYASTLGYQMTWFHALPQFGMKRLEMAAFLERNREFWDIPRSLA